MQQNKDRPPKRIQLKSELSEAPNQPFWSADSALRQVKLKLSSEFHPEEVWKELGCWVAIKAEVMCSSIATQQRVDPTQPYFLGG